MPIDTIPESYIQGTSLIPDPFLYDFRMTEDVVKTKVNLSMHMFSFLQTGKKQVHFADTAVLVDNSQSLLIKKGNCLWSELLDQEHIYYCKLLFFSEERLKAFLEKHPRSVSISQETSSYFIIENDAYLESYLHSLSAIPSASPTLRNHLYSVKFEELLMYLMNKYGDSFENYLFSLITPESSPFKKSVEQNIHSTLTLEEIAFLCNMSLSTFKRHFSKEYAVSPGKWLRDKRLLKAKELLERGDVKSSDIYLQLGYNNLSNFSSAFKTKFGIPPSKI
ncbi:helix-turn-helix domain-containing protein [Spongiimicrobium salis]|uniref:helix-turn-helix domain-containing protein n=1 Tax=Spongiimicrobium salis TaxID=1667022 RepID=UPI00374C8B86